MLNTYFKTAWRNLQRNKGFSLLNIAGLAVGLAATLVIALWIQDEIKHDKFHTNGARLYQVMANTYWGDVATLNMVPASLNEALKTELPLNVTFLDSPAPISKSEGMLHYLLDKDDWFGDFHTLAEITERCNAYRNTEWPTSNFSGLCFRLWKKRKLDRLEEGDDDLKYKKA